MIKIDLTKLSVAEALFLGFKRLNAESNIYLIPFMFLEYIEEGTELYSANDINFKFEFAKADTDTQYGLLAFGIKIEE